MWLLRNIKQLSSCFLENLFVYSFVILSLTPFYTAFNVHVFIVIMNCCIPALHYAIAET